MKLVCVASGLIGLFLITFTTTIPSGLAVEDESAACNSSVADILFILDSSGSVSNLDFTKMITFVKEMVKGFDVGKDKIRVAVSLFAGGTVEKFHLNKHTDKNALLTAIGAIQRISGNTNTADALTRARTITFTAGNGDRPKVPNIAIVITDGNSNNAQMTATAAASLKGTQAVVFSIGVGNNIRQSELKAIATGPDTSHVFTVTNFAALNTIKKELATKTCEAQKIIPTIIPTDAPDCNVSMADILFILDSSGSVSNPDFSRMITFVKEMVKGFDIGNNTVRIAVSLFSGGTVEKFHLNKYFDKTTLLNAIGQISRISGSTNTANALTRARTINFQPPHGDRSKAPNIAIVITDGNSDNPIQTTDAALQLKNTGTAVFSIGVGSNVHQSELEAIASDKSHIFTVTNFQALENIKKKLAVKTCEAQIIPTEPTITCNQSMADIVFLLDSSGSVGSSNFQKMLQFVKNMVNGFDIGKDTVRIGVASFSNQPVQHFALNTYFNQSQIIDAISKLPYYQGSTNTASALSLLRSSVFTAASGDRPTAPNIAIVITDGQSNDPLSTAAQAKALRQTGTILFSIGVGSGVNAKELNNMASDPDKDHVFTVSDFSAFGSIQKELAIKACEAQKYTPLPPTKSPVVCNRTMADIIFALDTSASVDEHSYKLMLTFVHRMVQSFDIGKDDVRVGLVTFSDNSVLEFHLNKYFNASELNKAISNVKYKAGSTNTADALRYIRTISLLPQNGNRPNIPNIVIVLTDGKSNVPASTTAEAMKLKKLATVFSIGIGSQAVYRELKDISTDPDADHVFTVSNFKALEKIRSALAVRACEVGKNKTEEIRKCPAQADIVFILDSSGSVGSANFQKMLRFVETVSKSFNIAPDEVQIGVDTFDSGSRTEFNMNQHKDQQSLLKAVSKIPTRNGMTHMGEALKRLRETSMSKAAGMRSNVSHIAIMITDGRPNGRLNVVQEAKKVKDAGTKLFTIGIGPSVDYNQLNVIASKPTKQFVFKADNFDSLKSIASMLSRQSCNVAPKEKNITCTSAADIAFVLDSSGSVGNHNFQVMLTFLNDIVDQMEIGPKNIQVGVLRFNSRNYLEFNLNKHNNKKSLQNAIQNIHYNPGNTATGSAISFMHYHMFTRASGFRKGVPKIAIVITDGMSNIGLNTKVEADQAKKDNITLFAIGIGGAVNQRELKDIASNPNFVFSTNNFKNLNKIVDGLVKTTCKEIPIDSKPFVCKDKLASCASFGMKVCDGYQRWSRDFCPKYCGVCFDPPNCVDEAPSCSKLGTENCVEYPAWSRENCARFCGFCGGDGNRTIGDRVHFCLYKGKRYATGETWKDGCEYECSCLDALRGVFSCWSRCPVYYDIPPQCTMVNVPGSCCKKPICDFGGKSTTSTGHHKGSRFGVDVCVYKGKEYYQDQTWSDGCQSECICKNADSGLWVCQSKCPHYKSLPSICHLEKKDGQCCSEVKCEFIVDFGKIKGGGKIVDKVDPVIPSKCVDKLNCHQYGIAICSAPDLQAWVQKNCPLYCHSCPTPSVPQNGACLVGSKVYKPGETWQESCSMTCVCEDGLRGIARCYDKCAHFSNLPPNCQKVTLAGECCPKIKCDQGTIIDSGGSSNTSTGHSIQGCMYKGHYYPKDQVWIDGCDYSCKCIDGTQGIYECTERCPTFRNLPSDCHMVDVPGDTCCQMPVCNTTHILIPDYGKKHIGGGKVTIPTKDGCIFDGKHYSEGEKWRDGCKYFCECSDGKRGIYICKERCTNLGVIPNHCAAINDPHDDCCRQMVCTNITDIVPRTTTPAAIGKCYYKGQSYTKGQTWEDGCSLRCTCEDEVTGYYSCIDRCPGYSSIPTTCQLKPDPKDPKCCKMPDCQSSNKPVPLRGLRNGFGRSPRPVPSQQNVCLFNQTTYRQGESWNVDCKMKCDCTDAKKQLFKCQSRCNEYSSIPSHCQKTYVNNSCCPQVQCSSNPACKDLVGVCQSAGSQICQGQFKDFAIKNCRKTCGYCDTPIATTLPPDCLDTDPKCADYTGFDVCSPVLFNFAITHCRRFCRYCDRPIP